MVEAGLEGAVAVGTPSSAHHETDHSLDDSSERRADGVRETEPGLFEHALRMAESLEAFVSMVSTHAALSDAAERKVGRARTASAPGPAIDAEPEGTGGNGMTAPTTQARRRGRPPKVSQPDDAEYVEWWKPGWKERLR